MAKDPTQGPVSTYDEFGNPIKANVDEPIVEAAEDVIAEEESEEATTEETVEEATDEEEASEDVISPVESSVEETTEVEEESDAPSEEVATSDEEPAQADVSVEGEPAAEDVAQPVGEDPGEEIERAEVGDETEKMPKEEKAEETEDVADEVVEEEAPEEESADFRVEADSDDDKLHVGGGDEEEFVTHEHEVKPPLTYNEAETMLMGISFLKMRELAIADGIKPERSRVKVMRQLLALWFPPPTSAPADDEPEMSVRIRRAKGLM